LCAQGGDVGARLANAGLCTAAAVVKVGPSSADQSSLTPEQVQAVVQSELAKQRPPAPVGPTTAQLAAAVQAFIAANPSYFKAPAPTSQQIQSAVAAYLRAHPVPVEQQPVLQQPIPQGPTYQPQYDMPGLGGFSGGFSPVPRSGWPGGATSFPGRPGMPR
jgi:hypothetical protein